MTADRGYTRIPNNLIFSTTEIAEAPRGHPYTYKLYIKVSFLNRLRFLLGKPILLRINLILGRDGVDYIESWRLYEMGGKS